MPSGASRAVMCQAVLVLIVLTLLADAAWVYLLVGHGMFWRTDQRLPPGDVVGTWPSVVAVVPARDEAAMLPETLPTLLTQDYPGQLTVLLVDDESTDGTAGVAAAQGKQAAPGRLQVLAGEPTPAGWAGKVWAMAQGLSAAGDADYILFTDADIAYAPGTLRTLVGAAVSGDRGLVSQMALLRTDTLAERLLIPAFVYFFAQLYPFRRVNRRGGRMAAAAGGCMLVRRGALEAAGGLEPISDARIDDVALAGLLKRVAPTDTWLGFSTDVVSCRRYSRLAEVWDMVARSAYTQLRYSPVALAGTVAGMALLYLLPVAAALAGLLLPSPWLATAGFGAWAAMSVTYLPVLRLYRLSPGRAACLPLIGALYTAMTVSSARRHRAGQGGEWKGRVIVASRR
ncbi:MAG TPA: glycosyltransferase [Streptosporangiaceae bacterium]